MTPVGIANISWKYYILYAVLNFAFVPIVQVFYEETAKLSLEQIDELFETKYSSATAECAGNGQVLEKSPELAETQWIEG